MSDPVTNPAAVAIPQPKSESVQAFELMQRRAAAFAMSPLVPEHLRNGNKEVAIANCYICLELANLMGESPLVVMQNIHFVKGKAGWNAAYMIARANASGYFTGCIKFKTTGKGDSMAVTASAVLKETGETIERTVDMAMAKAVGWASNEKYKQIPEQMLSYRAATFLIRLYCPQVMLGYQTADELSAIGEIPAVKTPLTIASVTADESADGAEATYIAAAVPPPPPIPEPAKVESTAEVKAQPKPEAGNPLKDFARAAREQLADVEHASDLARLVAELDAELARLDPPHKIGDLAAIARRAADAKERADLAAFSDKQFAKSITALLSHFDTVGSNLFGSGDDGAAKSANALKH